MGVVCLQGPGRTKFFRESRRLSITSSLWAFLLAGVLATGVAASDLLAQVLLAGV